MACPFCVVPTPHGVRLASGAGVLAADAVITSADPVAGDTITSRGARGTWEPSGVVVYVGQRSCIGPATDVACGALSFVTSPRAGRGWAEHRTDYTGTEVGQDRAQALGRSVFGALLTGREQE